MCINQLTHASSFISVWIISARPEVRWKNIRRLLSLWYLSIFGRRRCRWMFLSFSDRLCVAYGKRTGRFCLFFVILVHISASNLSNAQQFQSIYQATQTQSENVCRENTEGTLKKKKPPRYQLSLSPIGPFFSLIIPLSHTSSTGLLVFFSLRLFSQRILPISRACWKHVITIFCISFQ